MLLDVKLSSTYSRFAGTKYVVFLHSSLYISAYICRLVYASNIHSEGIKRKQLGREVTSKHAALDSWRRSVSFSCQSTGENCLLRNAFCCHTVSFPASSLTIGLLELHV